MLSVIYNSSIAKPHARTGIGTESMGLWIEKTKPGIGKIIREINFTIHGIAFRTRHLPHQHSSVPTISFTSLIP